MIHGGRKEAGSGQGEQGMVSAGRGAAGSPLPVGTPVLQHDFGPRIYSQ